MHVSSVSSVFRRVLQMFYLDVLHVTMAPVDCGQQSTAGLRLLPRALPHVVRLTLSSPSPPFPSLYLAAAFRARREILPDEYANARGGGGPSGTLLAWWPRSKLRSARSARYTQEISSNGRLSGRPGASNALREAHLFYFLY